MTAKLNFTQAHTQLTAGVCQLNLTLSAEQLQTLIRYIELLERWNKIHNLTAVRDINEMVSKHLLDSLAIAPYIKGQRVLDVGSGPGLPGIPLAVYYPDKKVVLLDSNGKKTQFLLYAKQQLNLSNVEVVKSRLEQYQPACGFNSVVTRAFSDLVTIVQKTLPLCCEDGIVFAMKGSYPQDELIALQATALSNTLKINTVEVQVPMLEGQRHLIMISRQ